APLPVISRIVSEPEPVFVPTPAPAPQTQTPKFESPVYDYVPPPEHRRHPDDIGFTTGTAHAVQPAKTEKRPSLIIPIAAVLVAVLVGGFLLVRQRYGTSPSAAPASAASSANAVPTTPQATTGAYP